MATTFHPLPVRRVTPEAAGAAAVTFAVPEALRAAFDFHPGQFLTLRAIIGGQEVRRSYSICSPHQRYERSGEIEVGIKPVEGGLFSRWALRHLVPGATVDVMPPDGRFSPRLPGARHRVGFAAGSGITPLLSIIATTLAREPDSRFTLVYGNQRVNTIMFNEALADLKDRHPDRLALVHLLSRQPQEVQLLQGRLDQAKAAELLRTLVPAASIDEAFLCGPEGMIESVQSALLAAGVPAGRIHSERFFSAGSAVATPVGAAGPAASAARTSAPSTQLQVVLDGKTHQLTLGRADHVLDAALEAGLDLPYSCKGGVCCTCRAKVLEGQVAMDRNFTLEAWEVEQGFVLTCQARALTPRLVVSYDER
ncbi:1,2-phenylacetyl-CoA epoxidase subunit PaaE [Ramlibacter tataouinensis]|uniref:Ferredoxin--NAD(+) reductase-like protein n=1 Tax=Ramlibacter tataouinensis (strain ATCC BAA-407 / DSM 14655 / LMG 21543 / TTB310) TaxID=365046 RepID=F5XX14_RAMTT|nr:1,2-phenylacetyl-CoA epoxidase subunit PaaE [Ramlibacter tataouinensis]AEG91775.1 Ferredoxin--NAD(+) reductase-like protein [Ramlibacter tataouinensis TTB310]